MTGFEVADPHRKTEMSSEKNLKTIPLESHSAAILATRLRALSIQQGGLPPHVNAYLRRVVDEESSEIQRDLAAEIAAATHRANERLTKRINSKLTLKFIGKSFGRPVVSDVPANAKQAATTRNSGNGGAS